MEIFDTTQLFPQTMPYGNLDHLYPPDWPITPFHAGELEIQQKLGVEEEVNSFAPQMIRPYMPNHHREFYQAQPFVVAAARDARGMMWCTMLFSADKSRPTDFIKSPTPTILTMDTVPLPGDALEHAFEIGSDVGLLAIEFSTRRRNRVNGRIVGRNEKSLAFQVDQSYGSCPQYIKPRDWWVNGSRETTSQVHSVDKETFLRTDYLSEEQIAHLHAAESIFIATGYRGDGEDPRFGNDASHRGGTAGFVQAEENGRRIIIPDYSGNNIYNTIGNIIMDPRMGITIPLYDNGGVIQISGNASIIWDEDALVSQFVGARRLISFSVIEVQELSAGSLPIGWSAVEKVMMLQVTGKEDESHDVKSFYLAPAEGESPLLPAFRAGQHLPLRLQTSTGVVERTYALSFYERSNQQVYRISVKREELGVASQYLHNQIEVGDFILAQKPTGNFVYQPTKDTESIVFLSAGIGATPVLAMLHAFVKENDIAKQAIWIHSVRTPRDHIFREEVEELKKSGGGRVEIISAYTREASAEDIITIRGRISGDDISQIIKTDPDKVQVYLCGPNSFVNNMPTVLANIGSDPKDIQYESF